VLLHAGVAEMVAGSAGKRLQMPRPVEFEGSAATLGAQEAQALAASACGHECKPKAKPEAARSI
jgi:hypothetical protein